MLEKIGNDAGQVWNVLNETDAQSIKNLKKLVKMTDKELYAAIGWLAREEKLVFIEKEDELYLSLK
ncbi:MAG: winged helix-turn-helix domain-containing protein [Dysgonamonadaceae bacterium]|jgi:hypothetical protein|nr:winged helix-turn-helix domain-containing protein [Dysgonamonadaceae bacterium]